MPDAKGKMVVQEIAYMTGTLEPMPKGWTWAYEEELIRQRKERKDA